MSTKTLVVASALFALAVWPFARATAFDPRPARPVLQVFTYRAPGLCGPCDVARPIAKRLAREYPIEFFYRDDPEGERAAKLRRVDRFPTFLMIERRPDGTEVPVKRWSGAFDLEARIRRAFVDVGVRSALRAAPRIAPRPKPAPKRRPPRPIPRRRPRPFPGPRPRG